MDEVLSDWSTSDFLLVFTAIFQWHAGTCQKRGSCIQSGRSMKFRLGQLGCLLILLGFHCLLRTGEILSSAKGRVRNNLVESVTIEDPIVRMVLAEIIALKAKRGLTNVPTWEKSGPSFRHAFFQQLRFFCITHLNFRPYSRCNSILPAVWTDGTYFN